NELIFYDACIGLIVVKPLLLRFSFKILSKGRKPVQAASEYGCFFKLHVYKLRSVNRQLYFLKAVEPNRDRIFLCIGNNTEATLPTGIINISGTLQANAGILQKIPIVVP